MILDASLAATKDKPKSEAKLPIISATGTESQTRSSPAIINQGKSSDSIISFAGELST
jgi:hypothetical protein